jgi:hypothetical protein
MGWLHKLLHDESEPEPESVPAVPNPEHLVPPALPRVGIQDPAAAHKRKYASKVCPSCEVKVKELPHETVICENCGQPIVVKTGEDGQWHLLREADMKEFRVQQEQIRTERFKADEEVLLEAGFLIGNVQVDVVDESDYQEELERLAGERSRAGSIEPVVALLTREPGHATDKNAIRVDVGDATVGYIQKLNAKEIQPLMQRLEKAGRPAWVRGWVVGGWEDDRSDNNHRIRIDSLPKVK